MLLALALCSVGGVVTLVGRLASGPPVAQKRTPLSNEAGTQSYPAFSPDGQRLAYSARSASKTGAFHVYVRATGPDQGRQLTSGDGNDVSPAWSPDGAQIAFMRTLNGRASYVVIPAGGGAERQVAEGQATGDESRPAPSVAWTPDGKALVVSISDKSAPVLEIAPLDGSKIRPLTTNVEGSGGDTTPAVSPDGAAVAFVRGNSSTDGSDIFLCNLNGGPPRRVTFDDKPIRGLTWTPDGRDLIYAANRMHGWRLWRLPAFGGSPRDVTVAGGRAQYPAVAPMGNRLVYADSTEASAIWRAELGVKEPGGKKSSGKETNATTAEDRSFFRSLGREWWPMYSPDGKKIADFVGQNESDQLMVSDADGNNRVQITHMTGARMGRLRWSPDSKTLLFDVSLGGEPDLYTVPAAGGKTTSILVGGSNASWSNDGKHIYYAHQGQIWRASAAGRDPEPLVRQMGATQPIESPDGKYIYYRLRRSFWRIPVSGGEGEEVVFPDHVLWWSTTMEVTKNGLYYLEFERGDRNFLLSRYDFAAKNNSVVFRFHNMDFGSPSFSVSPDGRWVIYPRVDQSQTDLVMIENYR